jgi:hypothetical protein
MKLLNTNPCILSAISLSFLIAFTCSNTVNAQSTARSHVTTWKIVNSSLSTLLNDGWKLVNISGTDVATAPSANVGAIRSVSFVYVLSKDGKYVTCIINDPDAIGLNYSRCRLIN